MDGGESEVEVVMAASFLATDGGFQGLLSHGCECLLVNRWLGCGEGVDCLEEWFRQLQAVNDSLP